MRKKLLLPIFCALTIFVCGQAVKADPPVMPATGTQLPPYPWEGNLCAVIDGTFPYFHFVWC